MMTYKHFRLVLVLALLTMSSCKTQNLFQQKHTDNTIAALDSIFYYNSNYQYMIRPDDKIMLSVWQDESLSIGSIYTGLNNSDRAFGKWVMVDQNGTIEVPKIGSLYVSGMTVVQLKETLISHYAVWIKHPIVDVRVVNKTVIVMGEVVEEQVLDIDKEINYLTEIISRCKGMTGYAQMKYIKVLRQVGPDVYIANVDLTQPDNYLSRNLIVHPGDVVIVPSRKYKVFDQRIGVMIPFTNTVTAAAVLLGLFKGW